MTCEKCRRRPGLLWQAVRSPEGWAVTRTLCPECAGLRPRLGHRLWPTVRNDFGWALFILIGAVPAAVVCLYIWGAVR